MRKVFPIFAIALSLVWIIMAFDYGLWIRRGPGGGFFPLVGGALTLVFSSIFLAGEIRSPHPAVLDKKFVYPVLAALAVLGASYAVGLLPALALFIFLWLWKYEGYKFRFCAGVALAAATGIYLVFVYWLAVPLPMGALGAAIFG